VCGVLYEASAQASELYFIQKKIKNSNLVYLYAWLTGCIEIIQMVNYEANLTV
jgi:hypothetical protein